MDYNFPPPIPKQTVGHKTGFLISAFGICFERFLFYGFRAVLTLLLVDQIGHESTLETYGVYGLLTYLSVLLMGLVGDMFLERRVSMVLGAGLTGFGFLLFYLSLKFGFGVPIVGLAVSVAGAGLFRTANFTYFFNAFPLREKLLMPSYLLYALVNLGAFLAPLVVGWAFPDAMMELLPLIYGTLAIFWSIALFGMRQSRMLGPEAIEERWVPGSLWKGSGLGLGVVGIVCVGLVLLGFGMLGNAGELFQTVGRIVFLLGAVLVLVLPITLGKAGWKGVVVLIVAMLALFVFWASFEVVWSQLYMVEAVATRLTEIFMVNPIISMGGCLLILALGIVIPIKGRKGILVVGGMVTAGWLGFLVLDLVSIQFRDVFGTGPMGVLGVFVVLGLVEILVVPLFYLLLYKEFSREFRSAGMGLVSASSFFATPFADKIVDGRSEGFAGVEFASMELFPWILGVGVLIVGFFALWVLLYGRS